QPFGAVPHVWPFGQRLAGVQPQTPFVPPPPHVSVPAHAAQAAPPVPQRSLVWSANDTHVAPSQHPFAQLVASQTQAPPWQR
ncbi:MAG TPA: hypothetical protein VFQ80_01810, partial [Thermomicrobiales bacterium]|nr:hypothetical protein [Thermomicrobiales bacterium]